MTSSPVKEINSLMNFSPAKAKGNLQENLAGNFSDAFSKASGQQSMTLQKDTTVQGNTKEIGRASCRERVSPYV